MKYDLIIFDLDDTLFDYHATEVLALSSTCNDLGIEYNEAVYTIYKSANNIAKKEIINYLENIQLFRKKRIEIFFGLLSISNVSKECFIDLYLKNSERGVLIDGVKESLEELHGIKKVIGTNGTTYPRLNKVVNSPISIYIDDFFSSEMLGVSKPDKEFFYSICKKMKIIPSKTLIVGDRYNTDAVGGINAGIDVCLISKDKREMNNFNHVNILQDIRELLGVVL